MEWDLFLHMNPYFTGGGWDLFLRLAFFFTLVGLIPTFFLELICIYNYCNQPSGTYSYV